MLLLLLLVKTMGSLTKVGKVIYYYYINIVSPNAKGQVVIPAKIRQILGINEETLLQVEQQGQSVIMHPVASVIRKGDFTKDAFLQILEETRGAWGPATKED
ncbi:MAG: AbrB/MazE/SpoVT family DNA-binding domain-containing protein, partial [candidate division Zixibacteria bacterium]|nr:AbrB/MazE/SpoVT family DNA-binding domain-containing protein [candidate division Zixibacteria bacterium]